MIGFNNMLSRQLGTSKPDVQEGELKDFGSTRFIKGKDKTKDIDDLSNVDVEDPMDVSMPEDIGLSDEDLTIESAEEFMFKEDLERKKSPGIYAAPEKEYSIIENTIKKMSNILGFESPLAADKGISDRARAQALIQLMATEEGVPISEFRDSPEFIEKFARGFTDIATLGVMPAMNEAMTGEEEFAPDSFEGYAGKGLGAFAGLLFGPAKIGEFIARPITSRIAVTKDMPAGIRILKQGFKEALHLSPTIAASVIGEAGKEKNFKDSAGVLLEGLETGAITGAIFGTTRGIFPEEVRHRAARIIVGLVGLNAQRAIEQPDVKVWERPTHEVIFDTAMDVFFMWKGLPASRFKKFEDLSKVVAENKDLKEGEFDVVISELKNLQREASRENNKGLEKDLDVKYKEGEKDSSIVKPIDVEPDFTFVSQKGNRYEKIGDEWYNSKGEKIKNQYVIKAAENKKKAFEKDAPVEDVKTVKKIKPLKDLDGEGLAVEANKALPGQEIKFDGQFDRSALGKGPLYQFTPQAGEMKGRTIAVEELSVDAIKNKLEQVSKTGPKTVKKINRLDDTPKVKSSDLKPGTKVKVYGEGIPEKIFDFADRMKFWDKNKEYPERIKDYIKNAYGKEGVREYNKIRLGEESAVDALNLFFKDREIKEPKQPLSIVKPESVTAVETKKKPSKRIVASNKEDKVGTEINKPEEPVTTSFRETDPANTVRNLEVIKPYNKIDNVDTLVARISAEVNSWLDGNKRIDIVQVRDVVNRLADDLKRFSEKGETPGGIFEIMSLKELEQVSNYVGSLREWANKEVDRVVSVQEPVKTKELTEAEKIDRLWEALNRGKKDKSKEATIYEQQANARQEAIYKNLIGSDMKPIKVERIPRKDMEDFNYNEENMFVVRKNQKPIPDNKVEIESGEKIDLRKYDVYNRSHIEANKWLESQREKPKTILRKKGEGGTQLYDIGGAVSGSIKALYNRLTGKNKSRVLEEAPEEPFSIKGQVREIARERRAGIDIASYDTNRLVNYIEHNISRGQREVMPFVIEKTDIPNELGRPDLQKILARDRKRLEPVAEVIKEHFDSGWKKIKANIDNLSVKQVEDYVTHMWDIPKHKQAEATNWFQTQNKYLEKRFIDTYKEGIEKGFRPKNLDIAEIVKVHDNVTNRAIENVKYIKALMKLSEDGVPLVQRTADAPLNWIAVDYPALNRRVKLKKGQQRKKGEFVKDVKVKVHPDLVRPLKSIFEERFDHPVVSAYEAINGVMKKSILSLSLFHHGALGEVGVAMGIPGKTANLYFNPAKIYKALARGELDIYKDVEIAKRAIRAGTQLGASADIPVSKIQGYLDSMARGSKDIPIGNRMTKFLANFNSVWDKALWSYLHDSLKLYGFETLVSKMDTNLSAEQVKMKDREIAQFVNDTFGGQNWEMIGLTPKEVQMMTWSLLSADWTVSTTRQALAPTGIGKVYKGTAGLRKSMGVNFWLRAGLFFGVGMNLLNAAFREWDIQENPQYYKDEDLSILDRTMFGNTVGKKTYLFRGRYEDGSERYIRWGKQFRDFFELMINPIDKLGGKAAPVPQVISNMFTGHSLSGFRNDDIYGKKGLDKTVGIFKTISKSVVPISVKRFLKEDMEFNALDVVMQSSKGMSRYKAIEYFKKAIVSEDLDMLKETYTGALRNDLPAFTLFNQGLAWAKTDITNALLEDISDIEDAKARFSLAESAGERARLGRLIGRLESEKADKEAGLKLFDAAIRKVEAFGIVEGSKEEEEEDMVKFPRLP